MQKSYKELLPQITTFIFDIDGVFTDGTVQIMPDGQLLRSMSAKDGFAVQYAIKKGYHIAIITGGNSLAVHDSLQRLGVKHIYLEASNKLKVYDHFLEQMKLKPEEVLYMGDDLPDYQVMLKSGVAVCPSDSSEEIKKISHYVSSKRGGRGCVRDILEQTLKVQGKWFDKEALDW